MGVQLGLTLSDGHGLGVYEKRRLQKTAKEEPHKLYSSPNTIMAIQSGE
jgi:hypothetical protein